MTTARKDKNVAALLALFFGGIGAHKFYLGQPGWGIIYLLFFWTFIPSIAAVIEFILLAVMDQEAFDRRFNGSRELGPRVVPVAMLPPAGMAAPGPSNHASVADVAEQIRKLHELRVAGLLTDDEFERQKSKLLDAL